MAWPDRCEEFRWHGGLRARLGCIVATSRNISPHTGYASGMSQQWLESERILRFVQVQISCWNELNTKHEVKFIIAPHNIKSEQIQELQKSITKKTVLFSKKEEKNLSEFDVFIIDTIGILTKIYSEAAIAYVGGGFGNPGVHNILEPATFGVPIVVGTNYSHFSEATALVNMGGCDVISNEKELKETFDNLIQNKDIREEKGHICNTFVNGHMVYGNGLVNESMMGQRILFNK